VYVRARVASGGGDDGWVLPVIAFITVGQCRLFGCLVMPSSFKRKLLFPCNCVDAADGGRFDPP
jgi:hypothetical protein